MSRHTRKYQCKKSTLLEYHEIIECIMTALDAKSPYTAGHLKRVSDMAEILCGLLGLNRSETRMIHIAAHLHDIGKIGIDDAVLNKEGKLDEREWEMMKTHPQIGANILDKSHLLAPFSKIVLHHHERFDDKGYSYGLKGKEIPLGSRIIALCDSIDAMSSKRNYRDIQSFDFCYHEIEKNLGKMYDPQIGQAVLDHWPLFEQYILKSREK